MSHTKPFVISKKLVMQAYRLVKANRGCSGIDEQSFADYENNLKNNLYKLWNRMSSGSYFPSPIRAVSIPKRSGGKRVLGIPTINDRIAQTVVKLLIESEIDSIFAKDSYGYRPNKSALDAIGITRTRCWKYDWVLEYDIKGLFDNISHSLLMKAIRKHVKTKWILLYIKRWLTAPMQEVDGNLVTRNKGVPQGGVISPILANLFLHYVFDSWMKRTHPTLAWCRYADDGLIHCNTEEEANSLVIALKERYAECGLELHSGKTKVVYCKDSRRTGRYHTTSFDFLGYTFRSRAVINPSNRVVFTGFTPAVSSSALKSMRSTIRKLNVRNRTHCSIEKLSKELNPILRGWINYYGKYSKSAMSPLTRHLNLTLVAWAMRKYDKLNRHKTKAGRFIKRLSQDKPELFAHWSLGFKGAFA